MLIFAALQICRTKACFMFEKILEGLKTKFAGVDPL